MEAALRTGYELLAKEALPEISLNYVRGGEGIRKANVNVGGLTLKVAVVSGLKNAKVIMEQIKAGKADFHFVEVMCCPVGCVSGGGQPKVLLPSDKPGSYTSRTANTYAHDETLLLRKSHDNPDVQKLYESFLGEPLGHESHHLLHTHYVARKAT